MHKFLVHQRGDHVGVATSDIGAGEHALGVFLDDSSTVEIDVRGDVPLGHKVAIRACTPGQDVLEYGVRIGTSPTGFAEGDYVHVHNLKSARW